MGELPASKTKYLRWILTKHAIVVLTFMCVRLVYKYNEHGALSAKSYRDFLPCRAASILWITTYIHFYNSKVYSSCWKALPNSSAYTYIVGNITILSS